MATNSILLPIGSALPPDGSTGNLTPGIVRLKSSAAAPAPFDVEGVFDETDKGLMFSFRMPTDFASSPVLKIQYRMLTATSGNVFLSGRIAAVTPGDAQNVSAKAFAADNTFADAVPGTVDRLAEASIALSNADSLSPGDDVNLRVARLGGNVSDTASGIMRMRKITLEYTMT